jgi:hypothetical protein
LSILLETRANVCNNEIASIAKVVAPQIQPFAHIAYSYKKERSDWLDNFKFDFFECSASLLSQHKLPIILFHLVSLKISAYVLQSLSDLIAVVAVTVNEMLSPVEVKIILTCSSKKIQQEAITLLQTLALVSSCIDKKASHFATHYFD